MQKQRVSPRQMMWTSVSLALAMSVLIYGALALVIHPASNGLTPAPLKGPVAVLAPAAAVLSVVVMRMRTSAVDKWENPGAGSITDLPTCADIQSTGVLSLVIAEAASVLGLLLFFLGDKPQHLYPYLGLSLAALLLYIYPRGMKCMGIVERAEKDNASR